MSSVSKRAQEREFDRSSPMFKKMEAIIREAIEEEERQKRMYAARATWQLAKANKLAAESNGRDGKIEKAVDTLDQIGLNLRLMQNLYNNG